jgi:hypothetical protein
VTSFRLRSIHVPWGRGGMRTVGQRALSCAQPRAGSRVVARLRGLVRRTQAVVAAALNARLVVGDLVLNEHSEAVWRADDETNLTTSEFDCYTS